MGEKDLLWREVVAELISTTTYYRNGYILKKEVLQCSLVLSAVKELL